MKVRLFIALTLTLFLGLFAGVSSLPVAAQEPEPTETATPPAGELPPDFSLPIPDDIRQPVGQGESPQTELSIATSDYKVIPILFVPNNLTPNQLALKSIDKQMQLIQRWYGEQLLDRTFSLEPARIVIGSQPLSSYYGACYPSTSSCHWSSYLWNNVFNDLANLGYPWQSNRVLGVFLQHQGVGTVGLGGGNQFLIGLEPNMIFADCVEPGCASSVSEGGVAHELGHAFGLPHTSGDEGGRSLMLFGFYFFPRANLANSPQNPEKDMLYASPFFNVSLGLKNGGFEACLASWKIVAGAAKCNTPPVSHDRSIVRVGLSSLELSPRRQIEVRQTAPAVAGKTYDFSGWLNLPAQTSSFGVQIKIQALSSSGSVLSTFTVANHVKATNGFRRSAASITMPARTAQARIRITAQNLSAPVYIDDLELHLAQTPPPAPLAAFHSNGDAVPDLRPQLKWSNVTAATSYRIQIASANTFNTLLSDAQITSPFYTIPKGLLAYDTRYFWRVRASNGAGKSAWSPTWSFIPRTANNYYNDEFESGTLSSAWSWLREDSSHWGFGGPIIRRGPGYIWIKTQAGDLLGGLNNAKNVLLRTPPPGDFEVSTTYDFWPPLSMNYQQGGLVIYQNDNNYLKLVRSYNGHHKVELLAEVNGTVVQQVSTPIGGWVPLKLARVGNSYSAYYSPDDGYTWQSLGQPNGLNWSSPKIGLVAYSQVELSPDPNERVAAYFEYFRVRTPDNTALVHSNSTGDHKIFLPLILK